MLGARHPVIFAVLGLTCISMQAALRPRASYSNADPTRITVVFDAPLPAATTVGTWQWEVMIVTRGPVGELRYRLSGAPASDYASSGEVTITLPTAPTGTPQFMQITLMAEKYPTATWKPKAPPAPTTCRWNELSFNPVRSGQTPDVMLSGTWVPAVGTHPLYSLDGKADLPLCDTRYLTVSAGGEFKTADRPNVDPDSFSAGVYLRERRAHKLPGFGAYQRLDWQMLRWEFSRKDELFNFLSAPKLTTAWSNYHANADHKVTFSWAFDLNTGVELGNNQRNHVEAIRNGYGAIARLVPGTALYLRFPSAGGLGIKWTSSWEGRVLLTREPLLLPKRELVLERGTRHYVKNSLELGPNAPNNFWAITIEHTWGVLPPAFKFVDHRASVGLKLSWKWRDQ